MILEQHDTSINPEYDSPRHPQNQYPGFDVKKEGYDIENEPVNSNSKGTPRRLKGVLLGAQEYADDEDKRYSVCFFHSFYLFVCFSSCSPHAEISRAPGKATRDNQRSAPASGDERR
jgi:hypothetical protein